MHLKKEKRKTSGKKCKGKERTIYVEKWNRNELKESVKQKRREWEIEIKTIKEKKQKFKES